MSKRTIITVEEVENFTKEHMLDPSPEDFELIEEAMLKGAELALKSLGEIK